MTKNDFVAEVTFKSINRCIRSFVSNDVNAQITYTRQKLNIRFQAKAKTAQIHKHGLLYYVKSPDHSCNQDYWGKAGHRIIESADHKGKDNHNHNHNGNENHKHVDLDNIKVIKSPQ